MMPQGLTEGEFITDILVRNYIGRIDISRCNCPVKTTMYLMINIKAHITQ